MGGIGQHLTRLGGGLGRQKLQQHRQMIRQFGADRVKAGRRGRFRPATPSPRPGRGFRRGHVRTGSATGCASGQTASHRFLADRRCRRLPKPRPRGATSRRAAAVSRVSEARTPPISGIAACSSARGIAQQQRDGFEGAVHQNASVGRVRVFFFLPPKSVPLSIEPVEQPLPSVKPQPRRGCHRRPRPARGAWSGSRNGPRNRRWP